MKHTVDIVNVPLNEAQYKILEAALMAPINRPNRRPRRAQKARSSRAIR